VNNTNKYLAAKNTISVSESLQERQSGICLEPNHAKMIWQGNKDVIVREKSYRFATNKPFYLIGSNECYGVIVITKTSQLTLNDFETLKNRHRITDEERKEWWPNKQMLYRYDFELVEKFDPIRLVKVKDGEQTFLYDVSFIGDPKNIEEIESDKKYNPSDLRTDQLKNNFRIAMAWHTSKTKGIDIPYSFTGIETILKLTLKELTNRGIHFHPENMSEDIKKLFIKISDNPEQSIKNKNELSETVKKYKPMDSTKEYGKIQEIIQLLYSDSDEQKYEVEKNYYGTRMLVAKEGPEVKLYSFYTLEDMTDQFTKLIPQIINLSNSNLILDCKLSSDESTSSLYVSDILYNDSDISDQPWCDRYKILKRLNFQDDVKEVAGIVVNNKDEARKAIKLFCWMNDSEGAIIKKYDSIYGPTENKVSWVSFKLSE